MTDDFAIRLIQEVGIPLVLLAIGALTFVGKVSTPTEYVQELEREVNELRGGISCSMKSQSTLMKRILLLREEYEPILPLLVIDPAWRQRCSEYASGTGSGYAVGTKYPDSSQ